MEIFKEQLKDINQLTNRQAMLLPNYYVPSRLDEVYSYFRQLRLLSINKLIDITKNSNYELICRFVAGTLLGLMEDPRVNKFVPDMIEIPTARVSIGLEINEIDVVLEKYKALGIRREWIEKETPVFEVTINAFKIARYPVTNVEYKEFLYDTQYSELPSSWPLGKYPVSLSNHPVYGISPEAADKYAAWLGAKTKRKFRLPTEIEWEYAAAGPQKWLFPWGNVYQSDFANTIEVGVFGTAPVGIFPQGASYFGIQDMAGNVEEYVADNYWVYPGGHYIKDDLAKQNPNYRIARGGSFARFSDLTRCTRRHGQYQKDIYVIGFRLAEDI